MAADTCNGYAERMPNTYSARDIFTPCQTEQVKCARGRRHPAPAKTMLQSKFVSIGWLIEYL